MNPVVHFEMPVDDRDRASAFYAEAFGWGIQKFGPEMGSYVVVSTTETGEDGRPKSPGAINGGLFPKSPDNTAPSVVIGVDDIATHCRIVEGAGGKLVGETLEIPGIGLYQQFTDTEGNKLSMLQPQGMGG
jgi:hypothetical protein